jgi:hypothetical protein
MRHTKSTSLIALVLVAALVMTSCTFNVTAMLNTVISATQAILKVAAPTDPWAAQLSAALTALQQAETSWKAGGAIAVVEDALNTLVAVTAVIPLTAPYSALIDVLVAGVDAVLNVIEPTPQVKAMKAKLASNLHYGRIPLAKASLRHPTRQGAFKAQFNAVAKGIGLPQAAF